jgi:hypothetical protein
MMTTVLAGDGYSASLLGLACGYDFELRFFRNQCMRIIKLMLESGMKYYLGWEELMDYYQNRLDYETRHSSISQWL